MALCKWFIIDFSICSVGKKKHRKKHQSYKQCAAIYWDIFNPKDDRQVSRIIDKSIFRKIKTTAKGTNWANREI